MKSLRNRVAMVTLAALALGATGSGTAYTLAATPPTTTPPAANSPTSRPARPERHPEIRRALEGLREAKRALEHADHDFKGHREAALKATDEAIKDCEEALKADEK